jgi:hypothetical protein
MSILVAGKSGDTVLTAGPCSILILTMTMAKASLTRMTGQTVGVVREGLCFRESIHERRRSRKIQGRPSAEEVGGRDQVL